MLTIVIRFTGRSEHDQRQHGSGAGRSGGHDGGGRMRGVDVVFGQREIRTASSGVGHFDENHQRRLQQRGGDGQRVAQSPFAGGWPSLRGIGTGGRHQSPPRNGRNHR